MAQFCTEHSKIIVLNFRSSILTFYQTDKKEKIFIDIQLKFQLKPISR